MVEVVLVNSVCAPAKKRPVGPDSTTELRTPPRRELVEIALSLRADRVANVRLNVGRVLSSVISTLHDSELTLVTKALTEQVHDETSRIGGPDRDVIYFANRAISRAQARGDEASLASHDDSNK
eukprot:CAMPEP_0116822654 /NCGR_PEP_ID=MMETSP0418-20121206/387_1 /TAXON_ID=1158023 /ORGANISM="Astrosyne radiata, Strain 13vi08-1A" /LENGTH=123 /DNA_ID=CAMNT_0004450789 /DNA_START=162 /DNA_END=533 /DNA_ORIENTATION=-